jgi:hypothetical protein
MHNSLCYNIVTDSAMLQINPLLRNVYKQNEYIEKPLFKKRNRGRIVEFPQQRDTLLNGYSTVLNC